MEKQMSEKEVEIIEKLKEKAIDEEAPAKIVEDLGEEEGEEISDRKSPSRKNEAEAVVNIYTSFNNTIAHVTDMSGKTIAKVTGGMVTKQSRLKANPTIAMFIAKKIAEQIKEMGVRNLYIRIRAKTGNPAPGPGANSIVKSLSRDGFKILNIMDSTRSARGGPKKKGGRRGRRV